MQPVLPYRLSVSQPRPLEALALAGIGALATLMFLRPIWDIDIFWHIAAGRWIWANGAIPTTDIFGLDPQRSWYTFQWGYQLGMYGFESLGGLLLVRLVHMAAMLSAFGLFYACFRRRLASPVAAIALLLLFLLLWQDRINVRPHIFNLLFLSLVLPALLGEWRTAGRLRWAGWIAVYALWANVHAGGCLIALVTAAAIPAGTLLEPGRPDFRRALAFYVLIAVPVLISPNFIDGNLHALSLVQTTQQTIGEWNAPIAYLTLLDDPGPARIIAGLLPYLGLLGLLALALTRRLPTDRPVRVGLALAFTGLSLLYVRFVHFAPLAWLALLVSPPAWPSAPHRRRVLGVLGAAVCAVLVALIYNTNVTRLFGGLEPAVEHARVDIDERRFPVEAADFLQASGFKGTIFCHARYGGYLLWRLHPGIRTLSDGRVNVDADVADDIQFVHTSHRNQWEDPEVATRIAAIYGRFSTDALVVEAPAFAPWSLDCDTWLPVYRTPKAEIYYRNSGANAANLARVGLKPGQSQSHICKKTR